MIDKIRALLLDVKQARGLGFCVSIQHAEYMAKVFNRAGIPSAPLSAQSPPELRRIVQKQLVARELNFIFVVDLYNEGVDIPELDTIILLRPTESLTVFLQAAQHFAVLIQHARRLLQSDPTEAEVTEDADDPNSGHEVDLSSREIVHCPRNPDGPLRFEFFQHRALLPNTLNG